MGCIKLRLKLKMTLAEARKTLEEQLTWMRSSYDEPEPQRPDSDTLYEAMEIAISTLPKEKGRVTAEQRLTQIEDAIIKEEGFNPFASKSRNCNIVSWRQCIFLVMERDGYTYSQIGKAAGFDHTTIIWGAKKMEGYIQSGDRLAVDTWKRLNEILNNI